MAQRPIHDTILKPDDFDQQQIHTIAPFAMDAFLEDMKNDFVENTTGETVYLTEQMLDQFVTKYVPRGIREIECILAGKTGLSAKDFMWRK